MFEVADLEAFVESAERGTFSAAAAALSLTQPSLSRHIARLEHEVGGQLFDRSNRRVPRLAPLGQALLPHARNLLKEHDRFAQISKAHNQGMDGHVSISLSEEVGELALPTLFRYLARRFPRFQLRIVERAPGEDVRRALIERDADLIVMDSAFMTDDITGFTIGVVQHTALGSHDYLGHSDAPIEWEQLQRLPLLLSGNQILYPVTRPLNVVHQESTSALLRAIAQAGAGVAIVAGRRNTRGLQNRPIAIDGVLQKSKLQLAWSVSRGLSASAERLVADIKDRVADREPPELEVDRTYNLIS